MLRALKLSAVFHPSVEFLTSLGNVIVVGFGGLLAFYNEVAFTDMLHFYFIFLFFMLNNANCQLDRERTTGAGRRRACCRDSGYPVGIKDAPGAYDLPPVRGDICFHHISFSYIEGIPVLSDIDFEIKPGQMVALVGPTGVGKTTMTQLVGRFYDPTAGLLPLMDMICGM